MTIEDCERCVQSVYPRAHPVELDGLFSIAEGYRVLNGLPALIPGVGLYNRLDEAWEKAAEVVQMKKER